MVFNIHFLQGLAFTHEERQLLGINGLLPAVVRTEEEQVQHCVTLLDRYENDLDKYIYLNGLFVSFVLFAKLTDSIAHGKYLPF